MRWFVEISSLGPNESQKQKFCLEAAGWQPALKDARNIRGEEGPLGGFSIELLDDGARATDPVSRIRYVIRQAPANTPITHTKDGPVDEQPTIVPHEIPTIVAPPLPSFQLLHSREENPSAASPLTYREHVYAVDPGASDTDIERLLRARFEVVRHSLASTKEGRFVNLAIFDHVFSGKPERRPRATLTWKDWRGEPTVRFPAAESASITPPPFAAPTSLSEPVPGRSVPPPNKPGSMTSIPETEPVPTPLAHTERPTYAKSAAPHLASKDAPKTGAGERPSSSPAMSTIPKTKRAAAPVSAPPSGAFGDAYIPPAKGAKRGQKRKSGNELLGELFDASGDLQFVRDSLEGADFILGLALEKLPSELGLVSLFDKSRREFVVVRQVGGPRSIVLARLSERAGLAEDAMKKRATIVVADAQKEPRSLDDRFRALGIELKSLMVAPVEKSGSLLGLIELVNPLDGDPFTESDGSGLTYIGEQYAELVAARGIQLDPKTIVDRHQKA